MRWCLLIVLIHSVLAKETMIIPEHQAHPLLANRIDSWIAQLENNATQAAAHKFLLRIGSPAIPYLFQALQRENLKIQRQIILILRKTKPNGSLEVLLNILNNPQENSRIREEAAISLGYMGQLEAIESLSKFSFDKDPIIYKASGYAICRIATRETLKPLIVLLKHWDNDLTKKAHRTLVTITKENYPPRYELWKNWWEDEFNKDIEDK